MYQTDEALGLRVRHHLKNLHLESPIADKPFQCFEGSSMEGAVHYLMGFLGLDLDNPNIKDTPKRVAKMYKEELFYGLDYKNFPKCTTTPNSIPDGHYGVDVELKFKYVYDELVVENGITVHSVCEHHLVPFIGTATVAYLPKHRQIGLSKLNRVVDFFSRRPQVQERLTAQIFAALTFILETEDVGVILRAEHLCVKLRGVKHQNSSTTTSKLGGRLLKPEVRNELLHLSGQV